MAKNLFSLFDDRLKNPDNLVANPPQNLESISEKVEEQELVLRKIRQFETVRPRVNFSDFSNFVFFNSAYDYFNISGEKILNEYPYDGTVEQVENFMDDLDDYQRYLVSVWPRSSGHLRFNPASGFSYIRVNDIGIENGASRTSFLNPNTGSLGLEFWCIPPPALTGSNDVMFVLQKGTGTDGISAYFSGSKIHFRFASGSSVEELSVPAVAGQTSYFACSLDRESSAQMLVLTGSAEKFPVTVASQSSNFTSNLTFGSVPMYIASGSISSKVTRPLTGSLDNLRIWTLPLTTAEVTSSFNTKIYGQPKLLGLWRFNESGSVGTTSDPENRIVYDHSGHRINGTIQNYYAGLRSSGSLVPFESPDMILQINAAEVQSFISEQQTSGSDYDRNNDNIITRLIPEKFTLIEDDQGTEVLKKFMYLIARQLDFTKVRIDQFVHVMRSNYSEFDQAPDALLSEAGKFFGWEFTGNFLDKDAFQYILGKNVLPNLEANKELDSKLFEIKNEFWRRVLINLMYIYKTKGTRESVESLLRIYGVNKNFVRLKEYGVKPAAGITTFRIQSEKSVPALAFGSGSATGSYVRSSQFTNVAATVESRVRFPTSASANMTASIITGSIWTLNSGSTMLYQLFFIRNNGVGNPTGSLHLSSSEGNVALTGAAIFDSKWYDVAVVRDHISSSIAIDVRGITNDQITEQYRASRSVTPSTASRPLVMWLGSTGSMPAEQWTQEVRVWSEPLREVELRDHALNFQSFGTEEVDGLPQVALHWRLAENVTASAGGQLTVSDLTTNGVYGSGFNFAASHNPYKKFLNEYNYIASPEFGWNEEKIRVVNDSVIGLDDTFVEDSRVSLEFNMIDALNEDISQIIASMDGFNNSIGLPVNKYRAVYHDLEVLRENYFRRLQGNLNFRVFADMLEFFDRSFIDIVRRLIPAKAVFMGDEFVVESHMLERPKFQWNYRRQERVFQPEGRITILIRD